MGSVVERPDAFTSMRCLSRFVNFGVLVIILLPICLGAQANQGEQTAKIFSVRKVLRNQYFVSRYPQTHYFLLHISLGISDQKYCTEYETPVLDEIADLSSATNQDVKVVVKGKNILIRTPKNHQLKARVVSGTQC